MDPNGANATVNVFPLLFLDENNTPKVRLTPHKIVPLNDNFFSRWYLRAHLPHLHATPDAAEWFNEHNPGVLPEVPGLLHAPLQYQIMAINRMRISNCALWLDMGLGKTFICLAYALLTHEARRRASVFLVICPVSVFVSWEDQIQEHVEAGLIEVCVAHGRKKTDVLQQIRLKRVAQQAPPITFILTSYETAGSIKSQLSNIAVDAVFLDESSKIKNAESKRTRSVHGLISLLPATQAFALSGTPSTTNPLGFFSQYEALGKGASGSPDAFTFKKTYTTSQRFFECLILHDDGKPSGRPRHIPAETSKDVEEWMKYNTLADSTRTFAEAGYKVSTRKGPCRIVPLHRYSRITGFRNLDRLATVTKRHAYVLKKEDVLKDLPPKTYVRRRIPLPVDQRKAYRDLLNRNSTVLKDLKFSFSDRASPYVKLHQIAQGFLTDQDGTRHEFSANPKLDEVLTIYEEAGEQKIIIYAPYIFQLDTLGRFLNKHKIEHRRIDGSVPQKRRSSILHEFTRPQAPRVLICNPSVAGIGLNLTWATIEIFMANWYVPDVRLQAEARCHRIGQHNAVTIFDLIAEGTLEAALLANTRKKINTEQMILSPAQLKGAP